MNIRTLRNRLSTMAAAATLSLVTAQGALSADWNFADTPLFLSASVKPNLIMAIDDSGSMDGELLLRGNDGMAWWRTGLSGSCPAPGASQYNFTGCVTNSTGTADVIGTGRLNFNYAGGASGTWKKFIYLFPNGKGSNTQDMRRYTDSADDHYAIPPLPVYAWSRSPEVNKAYFDPTVEYTPWVSSGAVNVFANANPTAVKWDPVFTGSSLATIDLTKDLAGNTNVATTALCSNTGISATAPGADWGFRMYTGMVIPTDTCIRVGSAMNSTVGNRVSPGWEITRNPCTLKTQTTPIYPAAGGFKASVNTCDTKTAAGTPNVSFELATNNSYWIRYFPATFYLTSTDQLPGGSAAAYGWTGSTTPTGTNVDGTVNLIRFEIKRANFDSDAHYNAAIQNFANWFQYYRKRHMALRAGLGSAFDTLTGTRVAGFTINAADLTGHPPTGPNVAMGDIDTTADKQALFNNFYRNWTGNGGTPNRNGVYNIIRNFQRVKNAVTDPNPPITHSCQRNFGMLFTDGFSNVPDQGGSDGITSVGNVDGAAGAPYQDTFAGSLADATFKAYETPLIGTSEFPAGKVLVPTACSSATPDRRLDCNPNLHMNFYAITLGTRGLLFDPDNPVDPYVTSQAWPTSFQARHPSAVDDIWHATINGRGQLLNAANSAELGTKLSSVLRSILERIGSASSAAVNSGSINSDTRLFQASFDSKDWSGKLTGRRVNVDGTLGTEVLATIPAADSRAIITVNRPTDPLVKGTPVAFTWTGIGANRQDDLKANATDTLAQNRLDWIRGVRTDEVPAANNLRKRSVVLGDIINSAPAYVGVPNLRYPDNLEDGKYSEFRADQEDRTHMVYAGGNDGMLHAFSSDDSTATGPITETMAFIPSAVFKNLHLLTSTTYTHHYYVDGTPSTGDAFFDDAWHTMLVGGLNKGGQEIYALDITNPDDFSESNAASIVQWEFTDADDVDLGDTFARPSIIRTNYATTRWMAGFGNGYNNMAADGKASTTGNAVLFLVNMETGALIKKIDTGQGQAQDPYHALAINKRPNGLSTPVFIDADGDRDVDYAYAGDLFGNLWKFDLTSSDPDDWHVSMSDSGCAASHTCVPLFTAINGDSKHQPITSRPNVSRGPAGQGYAVVFGTGKYLETADTTLATLDKQSFYGLLDPNTGAASDAISGRSVLQVQSIIKEAYDVDFIEETRDAEGAVISTETHKANVRVLSDTVPAATKRGWYMDLVSPAKGFQGEMQVTDSLIRNDHVLFTTLVPNTDPCEFGGTSWLMEMNLFTGARSNKTPWDLNDNGLFDNGDKYHDNNGTSSTSDDKDWPVGGVQTEVGITPKPATLSSPESNCDYLIFPGTSGGTESRCRDPGPRGFGRQSWRQAH